MAVPGVARVTAPPLPMWAITSYYNPNDRSFCRSTALTDLWIRISASSIAPFR